MDHNQQLIQAVHLAVRRLASHGRIAEVLQDVLQLCVDAVGAEAGTIYLHEPSTKRLVFAHVLPPFVREKLPAQFIPDDFGVSGNVFQSRQLVLRNSPDKREEDLTDIERATGIINRSMVVAPLMIQDEQPVGVVQLINKLDGAFDETDASVLEIVAAVCTMGILNAQLVEESERASSLVGMGRVGHDIGNLVSSMIYPLRFSSFLADRIANDPAIHANASLNNQMAALSDTLRDTLNSGDRINAYTKLISDLAAGNPLRAEFIEGDMSEVISEAVEGFTKQAEEQGVLLTYAPPARQKRAKFDRLFVMRIVQNLVGNALRAVKELGPAPGLAIDVRYSNDKGEHRIEVRDTGPGMSSELIDRILAGKAASNWDKSTGSGWGTRIVLELVASHNGRISIDSTPGNGATFTVVLPEDPTLTSR